MRCGVLPTGFSLVDLLAAITLFAILTGISAPLLLATLDDLRAFAAGVLSRDIQTGVDRELERPRRLSEGFSGVEFAALPGLPPVDPSTPPPGDDPVHLGPSGLATFTPRGTSTPGSLYVRGAGRAQYVVRIFGETGKTRILKYDPHGQRWLPR
jgi:hypothetical protein